MTNIAVADDAAAAQVGDVTYAGPDAVTRLVENTEADVVLNALVGALGLKPTLAALATGARLALANKESLVAGGPLVLKAAKPGQIVPVDSEHSALAQCLRGGTADEVAKLVLTASGGPFRGWTADGSSDVTPEQAGAHPTWSMGPMNTLNSASLVNKGLELIETHLLFGIDYDRIEVVVHPQSIVHSMVTFTDGSTLAQASPPDMKLPIALALGWPARVPAAAPACDFSTASTWEFEPLDAEVFPAVDLAREAGQRGGCLTAVYNAANEEAAAAFLARPHPVPGHRANHRRGAARRRPVGRRTSYRGRRTRRAALGPRPGTGGAVSREVVCHQMMFVIGIVLFALAILVSVALHECGHMWVARATGMKVRRYFVGFGPTLWSTRRPNKLGETEYGVKAIPLGGFCDIAGMTVDRRARARRTRPRDVQAEDVEARRGAVRRPRHELRHRPGADLRHRRIWGLPNLHPPTTAIVGETACVAPEISKDELGDCTGSGPAAAAGIQRRRRRRQGRRHRRRHLRRAWSPPCASSTGPTPIVIERDGEADHHRRRRHPDPALHRRGATRPTTVGAIGISAAQFGPTQYNPLSAVPAHVRVHRRPGRRTRQVAGQDPDQGRRAGARHRRRRTRPGDADQRGRAPASSAATPSTTGCGWRSGSSWPS